MGTPHRGSNAASLGNIVANIGKSLSLEISTTQIEQLVPNSNELQKLTNEFCTNVAEPRVEVLSFFETSKLKLRVSSILVSSKRFFDFNK